MKQRFDDMSLWGGMIFLGVAVGLILQDAVGWQSGMAVSMLGFMGLAMLLQSWRAKAR